MRFAMLEASFRDMYELLGNQPGQEVLGQLIQTRLTRLIKLVLNGWDDRNENEVVDYPQECATLANGQPHGGLQLAERALSGETGSVSDDLNTYTPATRVITTDRESDCVRNVAAEGLPSALADEIDFSATCP
jgi:hypothetical protein